MKMERFFWGWLGMVSVHHEIWTRHLVVWWPYGRDSVQVRESSSTWHDLLGLRFEWKNAAKSHVPHPPCFFFPMKRNGWFALPLEHMAFTTEMTARWHGPNECAGIRIQIERERTHESTNLAAAADDDDDDDDDYEFLR